MNGYYWLKKLSNEDRMYFSVNVKTGWFTTKSYLTQEFKSLQEFIDGGFFWGHSPQGRLYWALRASAPDAEEYREKLKKEGKLELDEALVQGLVATPYCDNESKLQRRIEKFFGKKCRVETLERISYIVKIL